MSGDFIQTPCKNFHSENESDCPKGLFCAKSSKTLLDSLVFKVKKMIWTGVIVVSFSLTLNISHLLENAEENSRSKSVTTTLEQYPYLFPVFFLILFYFILFLKYLSKYLSQYGKNLM